MLNVSIRKARAEDEDAVVSLWQACGLAVTYNDLRGDFRFARAKPNSEILVGVDEEGQIAGSVMVGHDGHRGWIYYVAAAPGRRRQGIGKWMVTSSDQWLRERLGSEAVLRIVIQKRLDD